jgi:phosphatidylglycerophosphate synthase
MLDRLAIRLIQPAVAGLAQVLARQGFTANQLSFTGFGVGLAAAVLISQQAYLAGLIGILLSRLCDGLDGAVARCSQPTDRGGFLDITLDFLFYAAIPLAFAFADPAANALAAAVLLAAFMGTGSSFLAVAVIAAKRGLASTAYPDKSFYFLGGLTEATETLGFFMAMCLWPQHFAVLAWVFAGLCAVTTLTRLWWGWRAFE